MIDLKYSEILANNSQLKKTVSGEPYSISILANTTVNPVIELLEYISRINEINPEIKIGNYDNIVQDSLVHKDSDLIIIFYDLFKVIDELPNFYEDIDDDLYEDLKNKIINEIDITFDNLKKSSSVIFNAFTSSYFNLDVYNETIIDSLVKELNEYVINNKLNNTDIIHIDKLITKIGVSEAVDSRLYNSSKILYTITFFKHYALALEKKLLANNGKLKKAIIFDCDNTLWHGILGEDGFDGIEMSNSSGKGSIFSKIQQLAVFLSKSGIIVGLCSKNNGKDVDEVLLNHSDMKLQDEHIVIKKVNWNDKATNLQEIASELNIGEDSIVFVDDSDFEINLVQERCPKIKTIKVPENLLEYEDKLLDTIYSCFNFAITEEDKKKTQMYKKQVERVKLKKSVSSIDDYLKSLEISVDVYINDESTVPRISQMTQKTNQFNLTTKRYTENEISNFIQANDKDILTISVSDKFGDNGITGLLIAKKDKSNKTIYIDTFLMSCRIIGRNIEYVFMDHFIQKAQALGFNTLKATYIPSKKNAQVKDLYENIGFELINSESGTKEYELYVDNYKSSKINYININNIAE